MKLTEKEEICHGTKDFHLAVYHHPAEYFQQGLHIHWHPEYEIIYVPYGTLTFDIDGQSYHLHNGEALFVNPYEIHSISGIHSSRSNYISIVFGEDFLFPGAPDLLYDTYFLPIQQQKMAFPPHITDKTQWEKKLLDQIRIFTETEQKKEICYELELRILLLSILQILWKENALLPVREHRKDSLLVRNALELIHREYVAPLQIQQIAETLHVSPEHFIRLFKAFVGKTPKSYLISYRIQKACSLLRNPEISISIAAAETGFEDMSYFSRIFKKEKGMTPREYQKASVTQSD